MPSAFSHAVAGLGIAACFCGPETPKSLWALGAVCAALPDVDVLGFQFGIRYGALWGHRGFTHSIVFAAALAGLITALILGFGFPCRDCHLGGSGSSCSSPPSPTASWTC